MDHMRKVLKQAIQHLTGQAMRRRPILEWPAWAANIVEMKVPANVQPNQIASPSGGANVNVIMDFLKRTDGVPGNVAECGVFRAATLLSISLYLKQRSLGKKVFGFDSFEGFDDDITTDLALVSASDSEKRKGGFSNTSLDLVQRRIRALDLEKTVELVPGFFKKTLGQEKCEQYAFVHLDCDIYESYRAGLQYFYPRLERGGIILFDEYNDPPWPGCNQAVDEFLSDKGKNLKLSRETFSKNTLSRNSSTNQAIRPGGISLSE